MMKLTKVINVLLGSSLAVGMGCSGTDDSQVITSTDASVSYDAGRIGEVKEDVKIDVSEEDTSVDTSVDTYVKKELPDLELKSLTVPSEIDYDKQFEIKVVVKNNSNQEIPEADLQIGLCHYTGIVDNDKIVGNEGCSFPEAGKVSFAPLEEKLLEYKIGLVPLDVFTKNQKKYYVSAEITATIDNSNKISESNENNNSLTKSSEVISPKPFALNCKELVKPTVDLKDYPEYFVTNGEFNGYFVVGENAKAIDNLSVVDIATGMKYNGKLVKVINSTKLDGEIKYITDDNLIVVGNPCVNSVAAELNCNPSNCDEGYKPGQAKIELYQHKNGNVFMLVAGYSGEDTRLAAKLISNKPEALSGTEMVVEGTKP